MAASPAIESDDEVTDDIVAWHVDTEIIGSFAVVDERPGEPYQFNEAQLSAFALSTGIMALHPFAREVVQTTVGRLGYPPYTMEFMRSAWDLGEYEEVELAGEPGDLKAARAPRASSPTGAS